jgi:hypothetical protein
MADATEYTKKANQARLKAQRTFVKRYPDEFAAWHDQVREEMGLPPVGQSAVEMQARLAAQETELADLREQLAGQARGSGKRARASATA